jgi:hypothetical protein
MDIPTYDTMNVQDRQRIDARIFVGEIDRLIGNITYQPHDPRHAFCTRVTLEDRVEYLREVYAHDLKSGKNLYRWDNARFDTIKLKRAYAFYDNMHRSGKIDGPMEALVDQLDVPYHAPAPVIHR